MISKELLPCLALFVGVAEALERQCSTQASFFRQGTIRSLAQVAREKSERLPDLLAAVEQKAGEQHPGGRFFAGAGELLLQLAIEPHRLGRVAVTTRFVGRGEELIGRKRRSFLDGSRS